MTADCAIFEMEQLSGTQCEPELAAAFTSMMERQLLEGFLGAEAASDPYALARTRLSALAAEVRK